MLVFDVGVGLVCVCVAVLVLVLATCMVLVLVLVVALRVVLYWFGMRGAWRVSCVVYVVCVMGVLYGMRLALYCHVARVIVL